MSVETTLSDIRERLGRMEEKIDHISKTREEDKEHNKDSDKALHSRIKAVENRMFVIGWGLFLTAIGFIASLISALWKGGGS